MPRHSRPQRPRALPGARITGGEAAGRRLLTEAAPDLRPATGLVRGALFNILGEEVLGVRALDLFAGVGTLGLEALSRGALAATFVDVSRQRALLISANLEALGWASRAEVELGDVGGWLRRHPERISQYQLVMLDPPFRERGPQLLLEALRLLGAAAQRSPGWSPTVVAEHHRSLTVPAELQALALARQVRHGTSVLSFYRRPGPAAAEAEAPPG